MKKITVIGTGYVGLVTGCCLADLGHRVTCVDKEKKKIDLLNQSITPIYEVGIENLIKRNLNRNLFFSSNIEGSIRKDDIIFIAVGTPPKKNGSVDLSFVNKVTTLIAHNLNRYKIIINKTTAPVGTAYNLKKKIKKISNIKFDIASNPEFLKEGTAIKDFFYPDRIIVGAEKQTVFKTIEEIYQNLNKKKKIILKMDINSAELTKYAANAMLATRISFMNELALFSEKVQADIEQVKIGLSHDKRIGKYFLNSGLGYGGSCFPKDVKGLIHQGKEKKINLNVITGTHKTNEHQKEYFFNKIKKYFNNNFENKIITIWGLSFKPKTDDIRESSATYFIKKLLKLKAILKVSDPQAMKNIKAIYHQKLLFFSNKYQALEKSNGLIICTEWKDYFNLDFKQIKKRMINKVVFDGRNFLKKETLKNGFQYFGIGN